jgi:hypothetical protein
MSSHVGTAIIRGFLSVKEAGAEELGGQPHEVPRMLTFSFEQGKPWCI